MATPIKIDDIVWFRCAAHGVSDDRRFAALREGTVCGVCGFEAAEAAGEEFTTGGSWNEYGKALVEANRPAAIADLLAQLTASLEASENVALTAEEADDYEMIRDAMEALEDVADRIAITHGLTV